VINEPKETDFKSFDEMFAHYFRITYKPIVGKIISFNDNFIRNGEYEREFEEIEILGSGSYGEVFKVRDQNDFYAMKKIKFKNQKESEFSKELQSSSTVTKLSDKRLVQYFDVWIEKDLSDHFLGLSAVTLYIQMELCDKTLSNIMKELRKDSNLTDCSTFTLNILGFHIASQLLIEILRGVDFLHKQKPSIIHRDLKPDNILLKIEKNGEVCVKIGDFGLVAIHKYGQKMIDQTGRRAYRSLAQSHTSEVGHIDYMAPEVDNGQKYNTKADIFSLGVIVQQLFNIQIYKYEKFSIM
jgi:serine/threonine protein kinase